MREAFRVRALERIGARELRGLCDVLVDCVEGGASVSFMLPMTRAKAESFWREAGLSLVRGERVLLAAHDEAGAIVGTVQVVFAPQENQPHRADLSKMLVHRRARRCGVGAALLAAAEAHARRAGRTLLVLDTANPQAERLYARAGWQRVGVIPDYALMPDGPSCDTTLFYKALGA
jgi:GNAT superfamily N-acetyltransferase